MSEFLSERPSFRLAATHYGDTLQVVAARELGDANRWTELIWLNTLVPPYITDDPNAGGTGILVSGSLIRIPSASGIESSGADVGQVMERDCALKNKRLTVSDSGDLGVCSGVDNFSQQLRHRVVTPRGQASRHPEYGCMIWSLQGMKNSAITSLLGAQYVKDALSSEYRIAEVGATTATVSLDTLKIKSKVKAIAGGYIDLEIDTSAAAT